MGLGKTAQSIAALESIHTVGGMPGPFLVIAPLTALGHWKREISAWTSMVSTSNAHDLTFKTLKYPASIKNSLQQPE